MTLDSFKDLMNQVASGWNEGDAKKAADCFTINAIYIKPPAKQLIQIFWIWIRN